MKLLGFDHIKLFNQVVLNFIDNGMPALFNFFDVSDLGQELIVAD